MQSATKPFVPEKTTCSVSSRHGVLETGSATPPQRSTTRFPVERRRERGAHLTVAREALPEHPPDRLEALRDEPAHDHPCDLLAMLVDQGNGMPKRSPRSRRSLTLPSGKGIAPPRARAVRASARRGSERARRRARAMHRERRRPGLGAAPRRPPARPGEAGGSRSGNGRSPAARVLGVAGISGLIAAPGRQPLSTSIMKREREALVTAHRQQAAAHRLRGSRSAGRRARSPTAGMGSPARSATRIRPERDHARREVERGQVRTLDQPARRSRSDSSRAGSERARRGHSRIAVREDQRDTAPPGGGLGEARGRAEVVRAADRDSGRALALALSQQRSTAKSATYGAERVVAVDQGGGGQVDDDPGSSAAVHRAAREPRQVEPQDQRRRACRDPGGWRRRARERSRRRGPRPRPPRRAPRAPSSRGLRAATVCDVGCHGRASGRTGAPGSGRP